VDQSRARPAVFMLLIPDNKALLLLEIFIFVLFLLDVSDNFE